MVKRLGGHGHVGFFSVKYQAGRNDLMMAMDARVTSDSGESRTVDDKTWLALYRSLATAREIDRVVMQGQTKPQVVFEIMGRKGELTPAQIELRSRYEEALAAYRNRDWDRARQALAAALVAVPNDGPSMALMERIDRFAATPPGDDWDKAWRIDQK